MQRKQMNNQDGITECIMLPCTREILDECGKKTIVVAARRRSTLQMRSVL